MAKMMLLLTISVLIFALSVWLIVTSVHLSNALQTWMFVVCGFIGHAWAST